MDDSQNHSVVIALGSNLGDRLGHFCGAVDCLRGDGIHLEAFSSVCESPAIGFLDQPPFLNMVISGSCRLPPRELLSIFHSVEERAGRSPSFRNAPRPLDLDLLFFDECIVREEELRIPHPRWKERSFVVRPLREILPGLRDPETGWSVDEIGRRWPMEPREIQTVETSEGFRRALKEWKR